MEHFRLNVMVAVNPHSNMGIWKNVLRACKKLCVEVLFAIKQKAGLLKPSCGIIGYSGTTTDKGSHLASIRAWLPLFTPHTCLS